MVAIRGKYNVIDMETGRLDRRIFVDQEVYEEELEKIFGRAWQQIGHVSLVPKPNDFFHTYIGEDPVILTRDGKGKLHAFLNMCRHRGNRLVRVDDGTAKNFMCSYHGWTFSNDGKLEYVPGLREAYYNELEVEELGLVEARVDTYAGIVFATWDRSAPSLEEYLGDARWYLDLMFNRRDCGMIAQGPQKWLEPVNWKTPVDNCSDNYHVPVSHSSSGLVQYRYFGRTVQNVKHQQLFQSPARHLFINGHSIAVAPLQEGEIPFAFAMGPDNAHLFYEHHMRTLPEVERRLGAYRANKLQLFNHSLFPNGVLGFRLALPRGPYLTEFWSFVLYDADAPEELKRAARVGHLQNIGISGLNEQDDIDNWRQVTEASRSPIARRYAQEVSMGVGRAGRHKDYPGIVAENFISESNQRHFYQRWQEFMNAESWDDIRIEPITAKFEGTATMHG